MSQPATVDGLVGSALDAGATQLKPVAKSLVEEEEHGPATRQIDEIVLLLGATNVAASRRFDVASDAGPFTDPNGFAWVAAPQEGGRDTMSTSATFAA